MNHIDSEELLTRYVFEKTYYRSDGTVKHNAFMPNRNGETSVYRISNLNIDEVWNIGEHFVARKRNKELLGRTDIGAYHVLNNGLEVKAENDPHPRHANIIGWPEERPKQKMIAVQLAAKAELYLLSP